jgi:hypothetical protein
VGFVVDKVALGQVFSEYFSFPFIPPITPQSPSPIIRGWYNRPVVAAVPKVPPHKLKKKPGALCNKSIEQVGLMKYSTSKIVLGGKTSA